MQIKLLSSVLLFSAAFVPTILATASPAAAAAPAALANPDIDFGEIGDKIDEGLDNIGDKINDTVDKVKDTVNDWVQEVKDWKFPTVTGVPENVKQWFNDAETWFDNFPKEAWEEIKDGVYPPEVSNWVNNLPDKMKQEAKDELKQWAEEKTGDAPSLRGVSFGFVGVAGVIAVAMAL